VFKAVFAESSAINKGVYLMGIICPKLFDVVKHCVGESFEAIKLDCVVFADLYGEDFIRLVHYAPNLWHYSLNWSLLRLL
jgi:hypothetical protein